MSLRPNPAGAVDAPIASLFILLRLGRCATDQRRSSHQWFVPTVLVQMPSHFIMFNPSIPG